MYAYVDLFGKSISTICLSWVFLNLIFEHKESEVYHFVLLVGVSVYFKAFKSQ